MNKLLTLYGHMLSAIGYCVSADKDGQITYTNDDKEDIPVIIDTVDGKRPLYLPTDKVLKDGDWKNIAGFHPGCESIVMGQSDVLNHLIQRMNIVLNREIQVAIIHLAQKAMDKESHPKLRLNVKNLLIQIPDINATRLAYIDRVIRKGGEQPIVSLKVGRNEVVEDQTCSRVCKLLVNFVDDDTTPIFGIKGSHKTIASVKALYNFVIGDVRVSGSQSNDTPYLDVIYRLFIDIIENVNEIKTTLGVDDQMIDLSWADDLRHLARYKKQFLSQPLPYNTGEMINTGVTPKPVVKPIEKQTPPPEVKSTVVPEVDKEEVVKTIETPTNEKTPLPVFSPVIGNIERQEPIRSMTHHNTRPRPQSHPTRQLPPIKHPSDRRYIQHSNNVDRVRTRADLHKQNAVPSYMTPNARHNYR